LGILFRNGYSPGRNLFPKDYSYSSFLRIGSQVGLILKGRKLLGQFFLELVGFFLKPKKNLVF